MARLTSAQVDAIFESIWDVIAARKEEIEQTKVEEIMKHESVKRLLELIEEREKLNDLIADLGDALDEEFDSNFDFPSDHGDKVQYTANSISRQKLRNEIMIKSVVFKTQEEFDNYRKELINKHLAMLDEQNK